MLFCRGAVGAAMGGLLPASFAIVGDMYPPEERPHAIAMMAAAWPDFFFETWVGLVHLKNISDSEEMV